METVIKKLMFEYYKRTEIDFQFWIRDNYEYLLEKEKEQIMEAYRQGLQDFTKHDEGEVIRKEQYYNQTYNQNES
jgi:hypothetical protein